MAFAAFGATARGDTWNTLTTEFGLSSEEAGMTMSWIGRCLLDGLAKLTREKQKQIVDEATLTKARALADQSRKPTRDKR
jgi:hypothetical protein